MRALVAAHALGSVTSTCCLRPGMLLADVSVRRRTLPAGPVRGFAVTLGIGIVTTVFTAFLLTRLIVQWWVRWSRPQKLAIS